MMRGGHLVALVRRLVLPALAAVFPHCAAAQNLEVEPDYSIWDVTLGNPVTDVPDKAAAIIACGTNGGPVSIELKSFGDWEQCAPEASGLREVTFTYDDEKDYIAKALDLEFKSLQGGTSIFAHPVIVSLLVDQAGIVQGRRIVTDNRIRDLERRTAVTLIRNFKARYSEWSLICSDVAMRDGEQPVGNQFIHELCKGQSPDGRSLIAIEASYLRKKGQLAVNQETQQVNTGYFESQTRFEEVLAPYVPVTLP
jgi:hypothetical protein